MSKNGVLLINLGTPEAPSRSKVKQYLTEFLLDPRVIDIPWLKRQLLVRGVIIPSRLTTSLKSYQAIWQEEGSPLLIHTKQAQERLQQKLGNKYLVEIAMRYQSPSIATALKNLLNMPLKKLLILPLFPQYASATTGSVLEKVFEELKRFSTIPKTVIINEFHRHPSYITAIRESASSLLSNHYDHILFSFHGLPLRHLVKCLPQGNCTKKNCCTVKTSTNQSCYAAQCYETARLIAAACQIPKERYTICFQSRLGKEPWLEPFTSDQIIKLALSGAQNILVFCPSFVADCLETLHEISVEYQELFCENGGKNLDLVPGLNAEPAWITALADMVAAH